MFVYSCLTHCPIFRCASGRIDSLTRAKFAANQSGFLGKRFLAGGVLTPFNERYGKFKEKLDRNARNVRYMAQALHIKDQGSFSKSQTLQVNGLAKALERQEIGSLPGYGDPPLSSTPCQRTTRLPRFANSQA